MAWTSAYLQQRPRSLRTTVLRFPRLSGGITHRPPPRPPQPRRSSAQVFPSGNTPEQVKHGAQNQRSALGRAQSVVGTEKNKAVVRTLSRRSVPTTPGTGASLPVPSPRSRWGRFPRGRGTAVGGLGGAPAIPAHGSHWSGAWEEGGEPRSPGTSPCTARGAISAARSRPPRERRDLAPPSPNPSLSSVSERRRGGLVALGAPQTHSER